MSFFSNTNDNLHFGSLNIVPFFVFPRLPDIVSEWAAIIPLVVHLANHRDDYQIAGNVALLGRLSVNMFPKLGTLASVSRLLKRTQEFLDQASTRGGSSSTVWDVRWGSVFPCANGAANEIIIRHVQARTKHAPIGMPEKVDVPEEKLPPPTEVTIPDRVTSETRGGGEASTTTTVKVVTAEKPAPTHFRRYQTLHVYQFRHRKPKKLLSRKLEQFLLLVPCRIIAFAVLIGIAAVLVLCGAYGTAAIVTCSATSRFATQSIAVQRPPGYLENNEHGGDGACMLVATHQNATEWHLFTGERAIVDTLLNKTMFTIPHQQAAGPVAVWLRLANVLQLLAMTFTAAQKDWDGVCLVALLVLSVISRWRLREGSLAGRWLADAGVEVKLTRFRFSGRLAMVGAVEIFGGTGVTTWMDDIVAPHPRRDAWLRRMQGGDIADDGWTRHDLAMIERNARLSVDAAKMMERELSKANAKYDKS